MGNAVLSNPRKISVGGEQKLYSADVTMSSSYATNGDTLDILAQSGVGLDSIDAVIFATGPAGHGLAYDVANKKVKAFNGTTEIANTTNLSAVVAKALIFGR